MELQRESGRTIRDPDEGDLADLLRGQGFAILARDEMTYIQCAQDDDRTGAYLLEYQDGSTDEHFAAVDGPIGLDRVVSAFRGYLRGDPSWRREFRWERIDIG